MLNGFRVYGGNMKIDINRIYDFNRLFSAFKKSDVLSIDLSEYKNIKSGAYKKVLKEYYKTYNNKGQNVEEIKNIIDEKI